MFVAWGLYSVRLPDFARTTTFRWALIVSSAFLLCTLVLFGFVYWQTAVYVMNKYDVLLVEELQVFASNTPEQRLQEIEDRLLKDPQHIKIAGSVRRRRQTHRRQHRSPAIRPCAERPDQCCGRSHR